MKVSLSFLSEYVDIKGLSPQQISDGLRLSGTENVLEIGIKLPRVVIGVIKEITKHPNADKLQITKTDVGKTNGGVLQIVCGASNIKVGQKVPVALIGAKFDDFEIKKVAIRGIESNGMLCSEKELGIGEDQTGIMILDPSAKVGKLLTEYLAFEPMIDAELTPNRGDCLSVIGLAREVAATFDRKMKKSDFKKAPTVSKKKIDVEVKDTKLCPRYIAKVIEGVKIAPSPKWLQDRLLATGVRPINNVVDVTNYVMLEWGQPLHAFDLEKIDKKIIVRKAKKDEKIITLDGEKRKLNSKDLVIADTKKPIALAGVMGGENSEISNTTTDIVLEAAVFEKNTIRKTAQRIANRTEASNRFEKGIPLNLPEIAIERAAQLISEVTASKIGPNTDILKTWIWIQHIGLQISKIKKILGIDIPEKKVLDILISLGFEVEKFDFKKEARKHIGKPYVFGASYKTHSDMAFDCSYLTDYIYSRIGKFIGYTSLAQFELGTPIDENNLKPGDILFLKGHIEKSATDHYFIPDNEGGYLKVNLKRPREVGHNAIYIGDDRIVHASHYRFDRRNNKWFADGKSKVIEEDVDVFLKHPEYLGARRYLHNVDDFLAVQVPWWRLDVAIEEDLIEEIIRIYGYDKLKSTLPSGKLPKIKRKSLVRMNNQLRHDLAYLGLTEIVSYSFVPGSFVDINKEAKKAIRISNPLSSEQEYMRTAIWPSLLEVAANNINNFEKINLFEIGRVYSKENSQQVEENVLGLLSLGDNASNNYKFIKGAVERVLTEFNFEKIEFRSSKADFFDPGKGADIYVDDKKIGFLGVVSKKILDANDLEDVVIGEIGLEKISQFFGRKIIYKPLPKYPIASRDIDLLFDKRVTINEIEKKIATLNSPNLLGYKVTDIYEGKRLPENKKSVTINLSVGSNKRTMKDEEISSVVKAAVKTLSALGGELRS